MFGFFGRTVAMEKVKRNVRMAIIAQRLTDTPNQIHTLSEFASLFGAAKSTISEDITLLAEAFGQYGGGAIETVPGAAGGVRYRAILSREQMEETVLTLCEQLKDPARILPGGFLYTSDLSSDPGMATRVGAVFSTLFLPEHPEAVLTMETKGIPIALMTAKHLSVPLLIARRDSRAYEGSAVKINYVAGPHGDRVETMTLERRAIAPGQRVLIVDDFAKNGGTLNGMADLAYEFQAQVVGVGVMVAARELHLRRAHNVRPLVHVKYKERFSEGVEVAPIQL